MRVDYNFPMSVDIGHLFEFFDPFLSVLKRLFEAVWVGPSDVNPVSLSGEIMAESNNQALILFIWLPPD